MFPHARAIGEAGQKGLEEERRLAYVGLTRARKRVLITFAANRRIYNQWQSALPSRFLDELPDAHVEREAEPGLHAGGDAESAWSRGARPPPPVPTVAARPEPAAAFRPGDRVFHDKFGPGTVRNVDGDKLEIAFDKAGLKKVVDRFVSG